MKTIPERIAALKGANHWSQATLAAKLEMSPSIVRLWEAGLRVPSQQALEKIESLERGENISKPNKQSDREYFEAKFADITRQIAELKGIMLGLQAKPPWSVESERSYEESSRNENKLRNRKQVGTNG